MYIINKKGLKNLFKNANIQITPTAISHFEKKVCNMFQEMRIQCTKSGRKKIKNGNDTRFLWQTYWLGKKYKYMQEYEIFLNAKKRKESKE